jgi:SAM-dependent methyltransferase
MLNFIKLRLKQYIDREITKKYQKIQVKKDEGKLWDHQIAITMPSVKFNNLLNVANYCDDVTYIKPEQIKIEKDIIQYIEKDKYPLPSREDREGYMDDRHYEYWLSGLSDYLNIRYLLKKYGCELNPGSCIYDLGCASGRVIRHFLCQEKNLNLWASDINSRHVDWVSNHLGENVKVFQNHSLPNLPIEDNSFDLAYAFSVFSHIDTFDIAWLLEIRRVLKPGGVAYLTIHSNHTWSLMRKGKAIPIYNALLNHPDFSEDELKKELPKEKTIYRYHAGSYRANVFYDDAFIKRIWGKYFNILEIIREGHHYQDVVLLRKS